MHQKRKLLKQRNKIIKRLREILNRNLHRDFWKIIRTTNKPIHELDIDVEIDSGRNIICLTRSATEGFVYDRLRSRINQLEGEQKILKKALINSVKVNIKLIRRMHNLCITDLNQIGRSCRVKNIEPLFQDLLS